MTTFQKVIKYLALAFAIFLIVNIISAILFAINGLSGVLGLRKASNQNQQELKELSTNVENEEVLTLKLELYSANLKIKKGDSFKVESNSSNISCIQNNNKVIIKEENHNWFANNEEEGVNIYIPEEMIFDVVSIEAGAGEIYIEKINTKELSFEIGAGKANIEEINISEKANIEGGAGKILISSGEINNLNLDMGVGEAIISSKLVGNSKINAGIGNIEVSLEDEISNYTITASKGIGSIKVEGKEILDDTKYGNGENYIEINGGIGNIDINK